MTLYVIAILNNLCCLVLFSLLLLNGIEEELLKYVINRKSPWEFSVFKGCLVSLREEQY